MLCSASESIATRRNFSQIFEIDEMLAMDDLS